MRWLIITALVAAVVAAVPDRWARAGFSDGNELYELCNDNDSNRNWGICYGYITGVADTLYSGAVVTGWRACVPKPISRQQVVDVVKRHLANYPSDRPLAAESVIAFALAEAWPCP